MHYHLQKKKTYAQNALGTNQLNKLVLLGADGVTLSIGLEVTKVTDMALGVLRSSMGLAIGVDWRSVSSGSQSDHWEEDIQ
jgi:hypothetical protein